MTLDPTTITGLPNASALTGAERVPMDQGGTTVDATTEAIAATLPDATTSTAGKMTATDKTRLDQLGADDSPTFAGLTITGTDPVIIPHLHGDVAGTLYFHVKNTSGGTLTKGTPVSVVNAVGDTTTLEVVATNPGVAGRTHAHGLLYSELANNGFGHAVVLGELQGMNTAALASSSELWVGAAGGTTGTRPATAAQQVATVGRQHATTGTLLVSIEGVEPTPAQIGAAPAAQGVTNGNSHNHDGGDGAQIAYSSLSGTPTLGGAAALNIGTSAGTVAAGDAPAAAITALKAEANPLPQYLQPAEIVAGTNMSVDTTTTPGSVILSTTGSGATPAGTATEIQYRNAGALGAIPNSAVDGTTGAVTLARLLLTANGAASASPLALTGTWFTGGTGATTFPQLLISPTGATLPTLNTAGTGAIINAPSGFTGDLLWLGVNGTRTIGINSALGITTNIGGGANITFTNASTGQDYLTINTSQVILRRDIILAWSNSSTTATADDLRLLRDAAHTLAQRSGSNAQTTRIYNTFTSATNFERAKIEWASNILRIGTEKGSGGGTARDMELQTDGTTRITIRANGAIIFAGLPTTNPAVTGQLWNDGGTLKISA